MLPPQEYKLARAVARHMDRGKPSRDWQLFAVFDLMLDASRLNHTVQPDKKPEEDAVQYSGRGFHRPEALAGSGNGSIRWMDVRRRPCCFFHCSQAPDMIRVRVSDDYGVDVFWTDSGLP